MRQVDTFLTLRNKAHEAPLHHTTTRAPRQPHHNTPTHHTIAQNNKITTPTPSSRPRSRVTCEPGRTTVFTYLSRHNSYREIPRSSSPSSTSSSSSASSSSSSIELEACFRLPVPCCFVPHRGEHTIPSALFLDRTVRDTQAARYCSWLHVRKRLSSRSLPFWRSVSRIATSKVITNIAPGIRRAFTALLILTFRCPLCARQWRAS